MVLDRVRVLWLVALAGVACKARANTAEPSHDPSSSTSAGEAGEEHPTVDLDLSPSGIAATIRGPEGAKAKAFDGHVVVDAEPDFHMEVYQGGLDPLAEKADVVRRWGRSFRRFVQDDGNTVIYETEVAGDNRFHFFSSGKVEGLHYHCKSAKAGAESIGAVQLMIVGCHAITAHDRVAGK
jgi:hypothetical protein